MTAIRDIIKDSERCITENIDEKYQSDVLGRLKGRADTVVFPVSTEEVSQIMKYAWENNIPVTPRGAGTNLVGSTVPDRGGIVLDMSLMKRILELDEDTMTAVANRGYFWRTFRNMWKNGAFSTRRIREKSSPPSAGISVPMRAVCGR